MDKVRELQRSKQKQAQPCCISSAVKPLNPDRVSTGLCHTARQCQRRLARSPGDRGFSITKPQPKRPTVLSNNLEGDLYAYKEEQGNCNFYALLHGPENTHVPTFGLLIQSDGGGAWEFGISGTSENRPRQLNYTGGKL